MKLSQVQKGILNLFESCFFSLLPCDDHDIQTTIEYSFVQPIRFFYESFDPVSYDTVSDFLAYRNPEPV